MTAGRIVYLHGVPGTPAELSLAASGGWAESPLVFAPDRNLLGRGRDGVSHLDQVVAAIRAWADGKPFRLVAFSLGAAIALRMAPGFGAQVTQIDLIAPAAPLSLGDFLPAMAGGALFGMAREAPRRFALICRVQAAIAGVAPGLLARAVLADCQGKDRILARQPTFRGLIGRMLATSLSGGALAYRTEILAYVQDWERELALINTPVSIWQGDCDNWVPPQMTAALAERLGGLQALQILPGLSHYSALAWYLHRFTPGDNLP